jgi:membrane protein YdbS with pleckstrin-like domain
VAFPNDSLSPGETIAYHRHPHWKALVVPAFWSLVGGGAIAAAIVLVLPAAGPPAAGAVGVVGLAVFLWLGFAPWVRWRSTHYVFTNKHILLKDGVFRHTERGIPLSKVNDVRVNQSPFERLLGCGTLTTESAGEHSQEDLKNLPRIRKAARMLKELVENYEDAHSLDETEMRDIMAEHRQKGGTS